MCNSYTPHSKQDRGSCDVMSCIQYAKTTSRKRVKNLSSDCIHSSNDRMCFLKLQISTSNLRSSTSLPKTQPCESNLTSTAHLIIHTRTYPSHSQTPHLLSTSLSLGIRYWGYLPSNLPCLACECSNSLLPYNRLQTDHQLFTTPTNHPVAFSVS